MQCCRSGLEETLLLGLLDGGADTDLINGAHARSAHTQSDGLLLLRDEILAVLQVRGERAAGLTVGVGHSVAGDDVLTGDLADLGHGFYELRAANVVIFQFP
jgi:hypothetical protein